MVVFVAIIAAAAFLGLSSSGAFLPKHVVTGSFTLTDSSDSFTSLCSGTGGYSDIRAATNVVLRDGEGAVLATGSLGLGDGVGHTCTFEFRLPDIPEKPFYTIEVGRRGDLSYSLADMEAFDWSLSLTLGD